MTSDSAIFLIVFGGVVVMTISIIILWHILHIVLCKKYDKILFKQPYFRETELGVYSAWPLSLMRSMGFIGLLGMPGLFKKRRFQGIELDLSGELFLVILSKLFFIIFGLDLLLFLVMIVLAVVG